MSTTDEDVFEFKAPIIVSKSPVTYEFLLLNTHAAPIIYNDYMLVDNIISDNIEFIKELLDTFSAKCSKYFSKPLLTDILLPRLKHKEYTINEADKEGADEPVIYEWRYTPYKIHISGTEFSLFWCIDELETKCVMDITTDEVQVSEPALLEPSVVSQIVPLTPEPASLESASLESASLESASPEPQPEPQVPTEVIHVNNPASDEEDDLLVQLTSDNIPVGEGTVTIYKDEQEEDLKSLSKSRLRAKIARFKMEREYEKYIKKWGYLSEDSGSDSD
jgi:hypothetical protein